MRAFARLASLILLPALLAVAPVAAQEAPQWRPGTTAMPAMPTSAELQGDWPTAFAAWFAGLDRVSGVGPQDLRATAGSRGGGGRAQVVRFLRGPVPVVVVTDRNGDGRADIIEYYRDGALSAQVIDADYSGRANSIRFYDADGGLLREDRL